MNQTWFLNSVDIYEKMVSTLSVLKQFLDDPVWKVTQELNPHNFQDSGPSSLECSWFLGDTFFFKQSLTGEPKNSKKTPMPNPKRVET